MKIRFEVAARKKWGWPYFLELATVCPSYRVIAKEGVQLHVVEFDSQDACIPVWACIQGWKAVAVFVEDKPVPMVAFRRRMAAYRRRADEAHYAMRRALEHGRQRAIQDAPAPDGGDERPEDALRRLWGLGPDAEITYGGEIRLDDGAEEEQDGS